MPGLLGRRAFVSAVPFGAAAFAAPGAARAAADRTTLRFVPVADLTVLDPYYALPDVTAQHCNVVYDTPWGMDESFTPQLQMLESAELEDEGRRWKLTLRSGLVFHDGQPVRADDVVASIRKWAARDALGMTLTGIIDSLSAVSDGVVEIRLKRPFPLLPTALSKPAAFAAYIMPRRIAEMAGSGRPIEPVGSGPYRYVAEERVVGSRVVYARFDQYRPRQEPPSYLAGAKVPYFERIVWDVIPDASTATASLRRGETDWVADVSPDIAPLLRSQPSIVVQVQDFIGGDLIMRFNALHPPFNDPAIRRAVLPAVSQATFMTAIAGDDARLWRDRVGVFSVGKAMSTDAGVEIMAGDVETARGRLKAAGYANERVVVLAAGDYPSLSTAAQVGADLLKRIGFNVELQSIDYGTMMQRREKRSPPSEGGWSVLFAWFSGYNRYTPAAHLGLSSAYAGWPKIDDIDALRGEWLEAPDLDAQRRIARQIQMLVWRDVPFIPLGTYFPLTAYKKGLAGVQKGLPQFSGVRWA